MPPGADSATMSESMRRDLLGCVGLAFILAALYALGQNGQWMPSGSDGAYYLGTARSLAIGNGYLWAGEPVVMVPPGWPLFIAAVLRVSTSFLVLNLVQLLLLVGAAVMWYRVLRRLTTSTVAFAICLTAGVLFEWHRHTVSQYS